MRHMLFGKKRTRKRSGTQSLDRIPFIVSGAAGGVTPLDFRRISSVHPITKVNCEAEESVSVRHPR